MSNNTNLTPPWYTLRNEFLYTFGNDSSVIVKNLKISSNKIYTIEIIVNGDDNKAFAIRQIIKSSFNFGEINVTPIVKNSKGVVQKIVNKKYTVTEVANLFCTSLKSNSLFKGTIIRNNIVFSIFDKTIIQFFNDDISDICQNYNEIASSIFKKLCVNKFKYNPTTPIIVINFNTYSNCISKLKFYCPNL